MKLHLWKMWSHFKHEWAMNHAFNHKFNYKLINKHYIGISHLNSQQQKINIENTE